MNLPIGFRYAGVHAGLKPVRKDVALIASDDAVRRGRASSRRTRRPRRRSSTHAPRVPSAAIRAVVVNSGNANALTGAAGLADVVAIRAAVGAALGAHSRAILTASTGMIGVRLPVHKLIAAAPALVAALDGRTRARGRGDPDDRYAHEARVAHDRARRPRRSRSPRSRRARA